VIVRETARLTIRWLEEDKDSGFILKLLNEPAWKLYIGDKGIVTIQDAKDYINQGPQTMYKQLGFGLYLVELKQLMQPIGICGLLKREFLDDVDLGFAFLSEFQGNGYAHEAALAILGYAKHSLQLSRLLAITSPENLKSIQLLLKLGFESEEPISSENNQDRLNLYSTSI
jgi:ribosomal-protein-alanine N-acetyltransferase